jgi:hypothetical protein
MATTTIGRLGDIHAPVHAPAQTKSFGRRLLDRYIDAQMQKARLKVNAYLQGLDDKSLASLGYTPADIANIRARDASVSLMF